jgi:RNA polymerase sigma-70 factor (ECF subfamily)
MTTGQNLDHFCGEKSDEELVNRSLSEIEYFACLYRRYERRLLAFIMRISNFNPEEAEDVLQEAFIKVWENLNEFDQSLKFSSWLYRIVHNQTITEYKKTRSFKKDQKVDYDQELFVNLPADLDLPQEINQDLNGQLIRKLLNNLSQKHRDVLVLRYFEDQSYEEIADIMKIAPGTVATFINRAKKAFSQLIQRQGFFSNL